MATSLASKGGDDNEDSNSKNDHIKIYTTVCSPQHCFAPMKPGGPLHNCLKLRGTFIPATIFNKFTNALSHLRLIYLTLCLVVDVYTRRESFDVLILDVLPTPLLLAAFLLPNLPRAYYCHFPDQLLTRNQVNGVTVSKPSTLRFLYRKPLDSLESFCTSFSNCTAVNSNFTKDVFLSTFPKINSLPIILYPAIEIKNFIPPKRAPPASSEYVLLSMNRFERKKNIELAIKILDKLRGMLKSTLFKKVKLKIAGGYDINNKENVDYLEELMELVKSSNLSSQVTFLPSVSDSLRASLLQTSVCCLYTPSREHFGIVPLEAMYAGCPVVARNEGGPKETVGEGCGWLCGEDEVEWAEKVCLLINEEGLKEEMGEKGHRRVIEKFGEEAFEDGVRDFIDRAVQANGKDKGSLAIWIIAAAVIGFVATFK
ncbi:hypothetical protein TrVE_jg3203 [Triparma verrucosa]|uniref:Alpha-1,3/1,6-mannosyltransferase ALG2 n=1 Tax=Triparma verrucosa TaxID=1606542 RepID=A0A9W7F9F8_9STRA|nr:hypothetical protein TrVE_jg3203 [Triparma verrucosa]